MKSSNQKRNYKKKSFKYFMTPVCKNVPAYYIKIHNYMNPPKMKLLKMCYFDFFNEPKNNYS